MGYAANMKCYITNISKYIAIIAWFFTYKCISTAYNEISRFRRVYHLGLSLTHLPHP